MIFSSGPHNLHLLYLLIVYLTTMLVHYCVALNDHCSSMCLGTSVFLNGPGNRLFICYPYESFIGQNEVSRCYWSNWSHHLLNSAVNSRCSVVVIQNGTPLPSALRVATLFLNLSRPILRVTLMMAKHLTRSCIPFCSLWSETTWLLLILFDYLVTSIGGLELKCFVISNMEAPALIIPFCSFGPIGSFSIVGNLLLVFRWSPRMQMPD